MPIEGLTEIPVLPEASEDDVVGLIAVHEAPEPPPVPATMPDREMGEIMVDDDTIRRIAKDDRRSRRAERREQRRERWAARHSSK